MQKLLEDGANQCRQDDESQARYMRHYHLRKGCREKHCFSTSAAKFIDTLRMRLKLAKEATMEGASFEDAVALCFEWNLIHGK